MTQLPIANENRVAWADSAINHYSEDKEGGQWGDLYDDDDTVLVDLLADLMHWAAGRNISFPEALGTAEMHYQNEVQDTEEAAY